MQRYAFSVNSNVRKEPACLNGQDKQGTNRADLAYVFINLDVGALN